MLKRAFPILRRTLSQNAIVAKENPKMKAWQVHEYGEIDILQLGNARLPVIDSPSKILVKVKAASVNPIDLYMIGGYGRTLFQIQRMNQLEFPLTPGRDFCGTVVSKGHAVNDIKIGDDVYGFVPLHKQGSFSDLVLAEVKHVQPKPQHLNFVESASLVYATMTAWSALFIFGNMFLKQREGLRVLVLGASGGVGTLAIQLLKSQNCVAFGTCSSNAVELVYSLGADCVYNYNDPDYEKNVALEGRYHIILDCAKMGYQNIPKSWKYDTYITLNSPLLINTDSYGLMGGLVQSLNNLFDANFSRSDGSRVKWGFFVPSSQGLNFINDLVIKKKINPVIHKVFKFDSIPEAFRCMKEGHLRGKIVIDFE